MSDWGGYFCVLLLSLPLPSVDKGTHGFEPQICNSATLLSFSVRPVRFIPVPCRSANLWLKTPQDLKYRLWVADKATERGVLDVRRLTLTPTAAKKRYLRRVSPCSLRVEYPIPKQVKPKLNTAISSKISIGSPLLSLDSLAGFYVIGESQSLRRGRTAYHLGIPG